jgi:hypothetical protein
MYNVKALTSAAPLYFPADRQVWSTSPVGFGFGGPPAVASQHQRRNGLRFIHINIDTFIKLVPCFVRRAWESFRGSPRAITVSLVYASPAPVTPSSGTMMLVDPALWTAFHQAKDALITALREASVKHVHATFTGRTVAPSSTNTLIQAISEAERELKAAHDDLSNIRSYVAQTRAVVVNWSSPFAMLPHELIRGIISHTIRLQGNRVAILRLSQVSQRLRETVLDMSWLFTEADWNYWQYPLVELWCQRAGTQLLKISLRDAGLIRCIRTPDFRVSLVSCSPRWGAFDIHLADLTMEDQRVADIVQSLLRGSAPSLRALVLDSKPRDRTVNFELDCPSTLHVVLSGIWVLFPTPPVSPTNLTFCLEYREDWPHWVEALNSCPLLQRLTLDARHYSGGNLDIDHSAKTSLPSLVYLGLITVGEDDIETIGRFFSCFDIPNLEHVALSRAGCSAELFRILVRSQFSTLDT